MLVGRYECNINKVAISIPWINSKQLELPCFYTVLEHNSKIHIYIHKKCISHDAKNIESGQCTVNENNEWLLPSSVLLSIKESQCVWIGMGDRAELLTKNQLDEAELSSDELNILKNKLSELYKL